MSWKSTFSNIKKSTTKLLKKIGIVQSAILLTIFYYLILSPFALIYQLAIKMTQKPKDKSTYWLKRHDQPPTNETLQKQY